MGIPGVPAAHSGPSSDDQCHGNPYGAPESRIVEGPRLAECEALRDHGDVLRDEDSDVLADYIDKSAFKDTVG